VGEYYLRLSATGKDDHLKRRDEAEARRTFGEIVEFAPEDPLARRHLGDLLSAHGWHDEALRQYETLAQLTPDDPSVQLLLARAAQGAGKTERAVRLSEKAAASSSPDSPQPVAVAARALASVFLAEARAAPRASDKPDELARLRARAGRLAAETSNRGSRVVLTWMHPELHPTLWTNALGSMMPAPDNLPILGVAEGFLAKAPEASFEVRLDPEDAARAARLGLNAQLTVITREGEDDEHIHRRVVAFRDEAGALRERVSFHMDGDALKEVSQ
jgi:Ca-activated chloride channel family protein